ncbi:MAG: UMP kinase [Candidatus Nitrosothermus koennekii]|nr:MAG: UMP kinase [Candidatus Nitrosothermus koennekii]
MKVVIKLSGRVFDNPTKDSIKEYATLLKELYNEDIKSIVIAGGGPIARFYINLARELGYDEASLDQLGIIVSRLNARLLIAALGNYAYPNVPESLDEIALADKIVVAGGLHVGQSTNATAAIIAEKVKADLFINATDVDGIYSKDPRKFSDAVLLDAINIKDLRNMLIEQSTAAGEYDLMDIIALKIIERSKIDTIVTKADPKIIRNAIKGRKVGTRILI